MEWPPGGHVVLALPDDPSVEDGRRLLAERVFVGLCSRRRQATAEAEEVSAVEHVEEGPPASELGGFSAASPCAEEPTDSS